MYGIQNLKSMNRLNNKSHWICDTMAQTKPSVQCFRLWTTSLTIPKTIPLLIHMAGHHHCLCANTTLGCIW